MLRACYRHAANALTVHPRVQMLILTSALLQTGTTCEKISGTNPEMEQQMQEERLAILEHPVVSGISDVLLSRGQRPGFRVSLRCQTAQQNGHGVCDVMKRWLHRVAEDASGLTFEEWDPTKDVDNSQPPVPMIINSSELRGAGFNLQEVIPPALEAAARSGRRTRGAGVRQVEGLGRKRFVLSADDDNDLRSRCE